MSVIPLAPDAPAVSAPDLLHRLTANLAHNVNNALTGVIGYLELALQRTEGPHDADGYVRSGLACACQAADAVRRIVGCSRRIAQADRPGPHALRRLAQEAAARHGVAVAPSPAVQAFVSASLAADTLDVLIGALAAEGGLVALRAAEEGGRAVLYAQGSRPVAELSPRLLEASLMTEIQGGALEVASQPGAPPVIRLAFPCAGRQAVRCDEAQAAPPAPHLPAPLGVLRPAG